MNERDALRLRHIVDGAERIAGYLAGIDRAAFLSNSMLQDAVIRNLEVIGEACANLSPELRDEHPEVPWQRASGIRNRLIHGYFDVDVAIVWQTAKDSLPGFLGQVKDILGSHAP